MQLHYALKKDLLNMQPTSYTALLDKQMDFKNSKSTITVSLAHYRHFNPFH